MDNKQRVKSSVFEDNVTKFKEESTPIQFSTATSLSSLTIDDRDDDNTNSTKVSLMLNKNYCLFTSKVFLDSNGESCS